MKNKILGLLFGAFLIVGLTGCGNTNENYQNSTTDSVNVRSLYEKYLKEETYKESFTNGEATEYTFQDINDDKIEELIISGTFEKTRVRTLIVSYNTQTKELYPIYNTYSTSGLMYNLEDHTILFIDRSSSSTIRYDYVQSRPNLEGLIAVKDVSFDIQNGGLKVKYPDGKIEKTTAMKAREESEKYTYVGFDYDIDGSKKEKTTRDIFKAYSKDGFDVNGKKLNYGLYQEEYGQDLKITLYPDGTCEYNGISEHQMNHRYDVTCRYEVGDVENSGNISQGIKFHLNSGQEEMFEVLKNDNMSSQWLSLKRKSS